MSTTKQPHITNPAKNKLKGGDSITGIAVFEFFGPSIIKIAASVGFDFIIIDTEHGMPNNDNLKNFLMSARDNRIAPVVTVISPERDLVSRTLDAGALGIILSHADTPEQVRDLVKWMKYPPEGERGLALGAGAEYANVNVSEYCKQANESMLVLPKIESACGIKNANEILSVKGVDGVVFGPGDLSVDMGYPGEWEHPEVLTAIESVIDMALEHGVAVEPSIMPNDKDVYRREFKRGVRLFGATRRTEFDLFKEAAVRVMDVYS